ncbi:1-acyl-sn-glycerol-3-phosphate acyltransferase [Prauserella sediminis]|uniref:1-acyl-sn-glycerol-3-phosphate acyltransferase n=1 Tax=Prauserella sediminis TaxID=577680 RepID=A0A839XEF1_9PSEU|nr:lysophospholipid acyltransferase family protein [Prauserella sediminis]MBB3662332.1 1-acyl-sn-glycerol-3-phosphate acyltransferase [Prauserella sediminis]
MRRTVALAKVLTGTLPDDTDGDHDTGDTIRRRAAAALDALGVTLTATGPLAVAGSPRRTDECPATGWHPGTAAHEWAQHDRMAAIARQCVDERRRSGDGRAQHSPRETQHGGVGTLVVANHVSWLDIPALLALEPLTFLAKREVASWPFIGRQARRMGTLLLDRWSLRGLPASVDAVAERLRAGETVMAFPEATTWCSGPGGPFRRAVFQAALDAGAPIRPVTLSYRQRGEPSTIAAFVGDDGLASSLPRVIRARDLTIHAECHRPLEPAGDRRALAHRAQRAVQGESQRLTRAVHATGSRGHTGTDAGAAHV